MNREVSSMVLCRKRGEVVVISTPKGDVRITLIDVSVQNGARLGFDAPRDVSIVRSELLETAKGDG